MRRALSVTCLLAFAMACSGLHAGPIYGPIDIDVTSLFNHDVILNNGGLDHSGYTAQGIRGDATQDQVDNAGRIWMTRSVALAHTGGPANPADRNALPDDGFFPANAYHPDIHLAYSNDDDGPNALTSTASNFSFAFPVPVYKYGQLAIFATTGSGSATFNATLQYADGTTDARTISVPDWFNEVTQGANVFDLINGLDRLNRANGAYENNNDPAIFGFNLHPDPAKWLTGVTLQKTSGGGSRVNFYGATGLVPEPTTLGLCAAGLLALLRRRRRA